MSGNDKSNEGNRTEYAKDALIASKDVEPSDIQDFVERRAKQPLQFGDITVWSFNNHTVNEKQLERQAGKLNFDKFIIPYQASGIWGYMFSLLPERIRTAEILTYRSNEGRYYAYPNYAYHSDDEDNEDTKQRIDEYLNRDS